MITRGFRIKVDQPTSVDWASSPPPPPTYFAAGSKHWCVPKQIMLLQAAQLVGVTCIMCSSYLQECIQVDLQQALV